MRTQFSRRARPLSPLGALALAALALLALLFVLLRLLAPGALSAIASPVFLAGSALTSAMPLPDDGSRLASLASENAALRAENAVLRAGIVPEEGASARVISRPPMTPYDILLLEGGTDDGIYDGMRVFAHGIPVGVIREAGRTSARAALYSAPGTTVEAWAGEARVPLTLAGAGAGAFRADAPREAGIVEGDVVYIGSVPSGVVAKVETHASAPRAVISVRPLANIFSLTLVDVLPSPAP